MALWIYIEREALWIIMKFVPTFYENENLSLADWKRVRAIIHLIALIFFSMLRRFFNIDFCDNISLFKIKSNSQLASMEFYTEKDLWFFTLCKIRKRFVTRLWLKKRRGMNNVKMCKTTRFVTRFWFKNRKT